MFITFMFAAALRPATLDSLQIDSAAFQSGISALPFCHTIATSESNNPGVTHQRHSCPLWWRHLCNVCRITVSVAVTVGLYPLQRKLNLHYANDDYTQVRQNKVAP